MQLRVKWPNDIYYDGPPTAAAGSNKLIKVGGVLVTTSISGSQAVAAVGCGLNLNNERPTVCLNELIRRVGGRPVSLESLLAAVFNRLEELVAMTSSIDRLVRLYHDNWLHSGASVTVRLAGAETAVAASISGIDEFGFLRVRTADGAEHTAHPDGNSFDMLSGLIAPRDL